MSDLLYQKGVSYHEAYAAEQRRGRIWFLSWVAVSLAGPLVTDGWWKVGWFLVVVLWILFLFKHYSRDAVRHRAFWASEGK